jgi:enoyl-CoA hydratase
VDFLQGSTESVVGCVHEHVGVISYNRPERHNALNDDASNRFRSLVAAHLANDDVRCILLRGEGSSFSSGRDVAELGQRHEGQTDEEYIRIAQEGKVALFTSPKPVVVGLRGYALGGALETALLGDIRIGATDLMAGLPEVGFGLVPDTGGTQLLAEVVGSSRAMYMIMTGERIPAITAHEWGLVDLLVEPARLDDDVFELAATIAARPPLAVQAAKALVNEHRGERLAQTLADELEAQVRLFRSEDRYELRAARREGRRPRFRGC